jgi:hypothetical protein
MKDVITVLDNIFTNTDIQYAFLKKFFNMKTISHSKYIHRKKSPDLTSRCYLAKYLNGEISINYIIVKDMLGHYRQNIDYYGSHSHCVTVTEGKEFLSSPKFLEHLGFYVPSHMAILGATLKHIDNSSFFNVGNLIFPFLFPSHSTLCSENLNPFFSPNILFVN